MRSKYFHIIYLFSIFFIFLGCGEDIERNPVINVDFPDSLTVKSIETKTPVGPILKVSYSWRLRPVWDELDNVIKGQYRLTLFVTVDNIGDRKAVNIKSNLKLKTHFGTVPDYKATDVIDPEFLMPNHGIDYAVYIYNVSTDDDLFLGEPFSEVPAGLKVTFWYTYESEKENKSEEGNKKQ